MICPKCGGEIEDSKSFCKFCGCNIEEALREKEKGKKKKNKKWFLAVIIILAMLLSLCFMFFGITGSERYIKYNFKKAVESGDLHKAFSYIEIAADDFLCKEDTFFGKEELNVILKDIDNIPLSKSGFSLNNKLDLSKYVQYIEITVPKGSELIFDGKGITEMSGTANTDDEVYVIGYVLTGEHDIEVKAPNALPYHEKRKILSGSSSLNFENIIVADEKSTELMKKAAIETLSKIYIGACEQKDFKDLKLPQHYKIGSENLLEIDFEALKSFFTDSDTGRRYTVKNLKLDKLESEGLAVLCADSRFCVTVNIDYSYTFFDNEDNEHHEEDKQRVVTVELAKSDDNWEVYSFYIPAFASLDRD